MTLNYAKTTGDWSSFDWIKTRLEIGTHSRSSENIIYAHDYFPR